MKTYLLKKTLLASLLIAGLGWLSSCQKEDSSTPAENTETIASASVSEAVQDETMNEVFDDVAGIDDASAGEDIGIYGTDGNGIFSSQAAGMGSDMTNQPNTRCFTVTVTPKDRGVFPKTVTVDFGSGCLVRGHLRKGKIITVYTGRLHVPGSKATTTFENYSIDSFAVAGTYTVINASAPGSNTRSFTTQVENGKITNLNSGEWCAFSGLRNRTQVEGNGTPFYPVDDVFHITGNRKVECSNGKSWTSEIIKPLVRKFTCRWFVAGSIKIVMNGTEGTLDFGDGSCDKTATITVKGVTKEITLR